MRGKRALPSLLAAALAPGIALAQPTNHIGQVTAEIMLGRGCVMSEAEIVAALEAEGFGISDFQAQVTALANGGYLVSADDNRLRLVNWGACS